eukprot:4589584-Amphidinium_carterae.1
MAVASKLKEASIQLVVHKITPSRLRLLENPSSHHELKQFRNGNFTTSRQPRLHHLPFVGKHALKCHQNGLTNVLMMCDT